MENVLVFTGRVLAAGTGALLICMALFLYEDEEGKLENRLEQWWQRIRHLHHSAISYETAFLQVVMKITSKGFDRLFGERLLGPKALSTSIAYSTAGFCLFLLFGLTFYRGEPMLACAGILAGTFYVGFFVALGSLGLWIQREYVKWCWLIVVVLVNGSIWVVLAGATLGGPLRYSHILAAGFVLALAVISDFFFVALTRASFRWASRSNSFARILASAAALLVAGACLSWVPIVLLFRYDKEIGSTLANFLLLPAASNFLDAAVSLAWLTVAAMMLLHRVIWPLIERPIHAVYRHHVFTTQRKLVLLSGIALLALSVPAVGKILAELLKAIQA